jgi:transcriptional regulator with XRE-family HTH domain
MPSRRDRHDADGMARRLGEQIGTEVALARANLGLTRRAAARLSGISPSTQERIERGEPSVRLDTSCRAAAGVGLKLWAKAYPVKTPSLRDTGQLRIAETLRQAAHSSYRVVQELGLSSGRSADQVFFGPDEIIHAEIERVLADLQAQYRSGSTKRDELAAAHRRPVRLILVVEDTRRNRTAVRPHLQLLRTMLPAGSREVMRSIRTGQPLGRDGLIWIRPNKDR